MANDKNWDKHSSEWVAMSENSRRRKEKEGKSLVRNETNLTDLEHESKSRAGHSGPHAGAKPPMNS